MNKRTYLGWQRKSRLLAIAAAIALVVANFWLAPAAAQPARAFETGEILVKFHPGVNGQTIAETHRQNGGQIRDAIPGIDVQVVQVPAGQEVARVAAYQRNPNVEFAEVNGYYQATWTPNDANVGQQWQYNNPDTAGTGYHDIRAFSAWDITQGSANVTIAILDTGIDQSHEDLAAKIKGNKNFTNSRTVDDKYGHGTHVAGSVAAITNNAIGVAGTCPDCSLLNGKVLSDSGSGAWSWIANGIIWATDGGAQVINMSLGGSPGSTTIENAVNYAWNHGVIVVAAAGNDGVSDPSYPAYYANVIAVSATNNQDAKASWSNFGSWVDVAAPGVSILSTAPDHKNSIWRRVTKYGTISGTSMASPHVAGLAGLIWSSGKCAAGNSQCVRDRIEQNADAIAGTGSVNGRINAARSLQ